MSHFRLIHYTISHSNKGKNHSMTHRFYVPIGKEAPKWHLVKTSTMLNENLHEISILAFNGDISHDKWINVIFEPLQNGQIVTRFRGTAYEKIQLMHPKLPK